MKIQQLFVVLSLLLISIQQIETKQWSEFYACQQKCREEKECDGKCAKDFNQQCNIFKEGIIGEEEVCEWVRDFWNDLEDKLPADNESLSNEYGEKWIQCYGHCINSLEDGYAVAYAECYQSCGSNILKNNGKFIMVLLSVLAILLI